MWLFTGLTTLIRVSVELGILAPQETHGWLTNRQSSPAYAAHTIDMPVRQMFEFEFIARPDRSTIGRPLPA